MLNIKIIVQGKGPREKVGAAIRDGLKDSMSATAWRIEGETLDDAGRSEDSFRYTNEGRF